MPVGVYVNDGSGRDSYVNGACLTNAKRKGGPKDSGDFWPTTAEVRRNKRLAGEPLSLSSTLNSPVRSDGSGLSPQSARGPASTQLPQLSPSHYVSPKRQLGLVTDSFAQRGSVTPRAQRGLANGGSSMESEAMFAARTGRFALSRQAPAATGKLPGLKLHQQIGVLDEV